MRTLASLLALLLFVTSCSQSWKPVPVIETDSILKSPMSLLEYERDQLRFSEPLVARDTGNQLISREQFLRDIASGKFLPLRLKDASAPNSYLLSRLPPQTSRDQSQILKQIGQTYLHFMKSEGRALPDFDFTDLTGKRYTAANMAGKVVVIKCWFVSCLPCVQEMPALNKLVTQYKDREDLEFISLAIDGQDRLQEFLKTHAFAYAIIPSKGAYMADSLNINAYPTHLLVDRAGKIARVLKNVQELKVALKTELGL